METHTASDRIRELENQVEALQKFKSWVHGFLDSSGVPHHPPGTHGAAGCRIGDRMDWLMAERDSLRGVVKKLWKNIEERAKQKSEFFDHIADLEAKLAEVYK